MHRPRKGPASSTFQQLLSVLYCSSVHFQLLWVVIFFRREQLQYWNENCFHYLSRGLRFDTFYWIGKKLFLNVSNFRDCDVLTKLVSFILALSFVAIVLPVVYKRNFPNIFLFGCIFSSLLAICGKVIVEFWRSDLSHWTVRKLAFHFLKGSYVLVTLGIMATAVWIFLAKATTNKEESPSESRDLNRNCAWLGFFDDHDLWHILSSFSLLMGSYLVLYISK